MVKQLKELIFPELKDSKHYLKVTLLTPCQCARCGKPTIKGMAKRGGNAFYCRKCYLKHIATNVNIHLPKRKLALVIIGLMLILVIQSAVLLQMTIGSHNGVSDKWLREYIIETYYPLSDKRISKDMFIAVVDAVIKHSSMPELAFAIIYHESRFNPSAISSTGARGVHQVLVGKNNTSHWVKVLTNDGTLKDGDVRDLNDPVIGVKAGDVVLGYHMAEVKGDLPKALMKYYGTKSHAENLAYMKKVLATYGMIKFAEKQKMKSPSWGQFEAVYP